MCVCCKWGYGQRLEIHDIEILWGTFSKEGVDGTYVVKFQILQWETTNGPR